MAFVTRGFARSMLLCWEPGIIRAMAGQAPFFQVRGVARTMTGHLHPILIKDYRMTFHGNRIEDVFMAVFA